MSFNKVYTVPVYDMPSYKPKAKPKKKKLPKTVDEFAFSHEDKYLKNRIKTIDEMLIKLTQERKECLSAFKKRELLRNQNRLRSVKLYALQLEDDCWYIGMSYDPLKRFIKHKNGKGAKWTQVHPPIKMIEIRETTHFIQDSATLLEDDMTLEYALKYGSQYVRGGGYCQARPRWPDMIKDNERII